MTIKAVQPAGKEKEGPSISEEIKEKRPTTNTGGSEKAMRAHLEKVNEFSSGIF